MKFLLTAAIGEPSCGCFCSLRWADRGGDCCVRRPEVRAGPSAR